MLLHNLRVASQGENMMRTPRIVATLLLLYVSLAIQGSAQVNTASLTGQVTDTAGAVIPNVSVTVKNKATAAERSTTTDSSGYYTFSSLPVGVYSLTIELQTSKRPVHTTNHPHTSP